LIFFFSSRRRHTRFSRDWSSDVCSSDLDLTQDQRGTSWMRQGFDKLLLDPPRSGAIDVLKQLPLEQFGRIVYVSCHPGSLARDAAYLVNERGWTLRSAGVMDMFPHTAHVESIAMFERQ